MAMIRNPNLGVFGALLIAFGWGGWVLAAWDGGIVVAWLCVLSGSSLCLAQGYHRPRETVVGGFREN